MLYLLFTRLTNTNKLEKVSTEVASEHKLTPTFPCSVTCISPQAKGTSKNFTRFLVNIYKLNTSGANKWHNVEQSISRARSPWVSERWVKFSATDQEKCGLWKSDWQQPGKRAPSLSSIPSPNLYDAILIVKPFFWRKEQGLEICVGLTINQLFPSFVQFFILIFIVRLQVLWRVLNLLHVWGRHALGAHRANCFTGL